MSSVVVVGGGLAGMATSALLAADGHEVTVLERDAAPTPSDAETAWTSWKRRGVGQFRQAYAVPPALKKLLARELPQINTRLERLGALRFSFLSQLEAGLPGRDELMRLDEQMALTLDPPIR